MDKRPHKNLIYQLPVDRAAYIVMQSLLSLVSDGSSKSGYYNTLVDISERDLFVTAKGLGMVHCMNIAYKNAPMMAHEASLFGLYSCVAKEVYQKYKEYWKKITTGLNAQGIDSLTLKGFYFLTSVYKQREYYMMSDIDLLIKPDSINRFKEVIMGYGFSQNIAIGSDNKAYTVGQKYIEDYEAKHYELYPFIRIIEMPELDIYYDFIVTHLHNYPFVFENNKVYFAMVFDAHHNLSHNIALEDVWLNPQKFLADDTVGYAINGEVSGWFIPARFYHEAMVLSDINMKLIANLTALVCALDIDYQKIYDAAVKYRLQPSLYYCYRFLKEFAGLKIPADFLTALDESSSMMESYRDWGDFLPKVFNRRVLFDITPEGGFSKK